MYPSHPPRFRHPWVQLASIYMGYEQGNKVKRWSAKENITIEIECPAIVEEYNAHIRGVDLCYMFLALYRIRLRTCKYILHAHGMLLHGHPHYKWMVAISEILRTKARLKKKTKWICVNFNQTLQMLFFWATRKRIPPSEAALHHHPPPMVFLPPRSVTLQHFLSLLKISDLIE